MGDTYHEPAEELSTEVREVHRALASLIEELEAVDWYHQRAANAEDEELKQIVLHNRDEELEHAAMALEWLRRRIPAVDEALRTYLFTEGSILELEEAAEAGGGDDSAVGSDPSAESDSSEGSLGIGSLKEGNENA